VAQDDRSFVRCTRCGHVYCDGLDNYKRYALRRERDLEELSHHNVPSGEPYIASFLEYYCPGCATLLQVDTFCPALSDRENPIQEFVPSL
jgi:acetone carboxylase gamma subunit